MARAHRFRSGVPGRRAVVIGAGSFGTAVAVLLARAGLRTTLQARGAERVGELSARRENQAYLPGVELPGQLRIERAGSPLGRADLVLLGVPSQGLDEVISGLPAAGLGAGAALVSLATGATVAQGLNAAGAAAGHIFAEVWRLAALQGGRPESFIGLAGTGDLVATALAPRSRNRRAGELLAQGVPAEQIPLHIGQAVEALRSVPLLASALARAEVPAPVTAGLSGLISGELPLDEWVALVRTTAPPPARWRRGAGPFRRLAARWRARRARET